VSARILAATGRRAAAGRSADPVLHIDWTACDGRGLCTELLPDLLQRDDWGYPLARGAGVTAPGAAANVPGGTTTVPRNGTTVAVPIDGSTVPVPGSLRAAAGDAISLCPRLALSFHEP
jgi:ferredoxin